MKNYLINRTIPELIYLIFKKIKIFIFIKINYKLFKKNKIEIRGIPEIICRKNLMFLGKISINENVFINASGKITIGDNVTLSKGVSLLSTGINTDNWKINKIYKYHIFKEIIIGDNVWLGANVIVCAGSFIPNNCIIGAGSVVVDKLDKENALYVGIPAKFKKYLG